MWDERRSAGCTAWHKSKGREGESVPRRRGRLPEDWGRGVERRQGREEVPAHVARLGTVFSPGRRDRRFESRKRLRKIGSCSSLYSQKEPISTQSPLSAARKIFEEGREFAGSEPEDRGFSLIVCTRVAAVGQRAPALRRGPIPGPSAKENAVEVSYAWERGRGIS
jgi:hypothetical protein